MPFSLGESEALLRSNGVELPRQQVIESYMVFGGVPHYLNLIDRRSSLAHNQYSGMVINEIGGDELFA